ncbi:hypothetical protein LRAMOSA05522 [Lichtheimia ramosa]|uniref:YEATS domain-containing protein n=1 Tax=Lichtheimia ramosa TaxID=688394 RepID=A0A077X1G7_9FUNG|nr:hypothetical protein LRAMOSA05522 [Lichtheimia ramosa]
MVNAATFHEMSPTMAVHSSDNARSFLQNRGLKTNRPEQKLKKHLNIQTTNKIIRETLDHQIWRAWTIQIHCCEHVDTTCLNAYIDHVEYILHESFQPSRIVVTQAPYLLKQEGWGEFELGIVFHLLDGTMQSTVEAPDEQVWSFGITPTIPSRPSKSLFTSKSRVSVEDIKGIDLEELTTCLESLDGNDLRSVYDIFSKFDTRDMSIVELKDEIWFDIFGLEHNLVWQLWDFCQMLKLRNASPGKDNDNDIQVTPSTTPEQDPPLPSSKDSN